MYNNYIIQSLQIFKWMDNISIYWNGNLIMNIYYNINKGTIQIKTYLSLKFRKKTLSCTNIMCSSLIIVFFVYKVLF